MLSPETPNRRPINDEAHDLDRSDPGLPRRSFGPESLIRHLWMIVLGGILGLVVAVASTSNREPLYTAWLELLVYNRQIATGPATIVLPGRVDAPLVQNQIELLRSRVVLGKVIDTLDLTKDPEFYWPSNGLLKRLSEQIFPPPPKQVDDRTIAFVEALASLRRNIDVARVGGSHIVRLDVRSRNPRKAVQIANEIARTYLQERRSRAMGGDVPTIRELYQGLGPSAYIVSEVQPPTRPNGLPRFFIVLGTVLFGVGAGAFAAILRDVLSNKIRNPEQLEYFLGLPCLDVVAAVSGTGSDRGPSLDGVLRGVTALSQGAHSVRSLGITSVVPADGTTTVALTLAQSISRSGKFVLLIDCSTASSTPSASDPDTGMTDPYRDSVDEFDRCTAQVHALHSLIPRVASLYDFVIVDLPPLALSADARVAARALDGLLLVVKSDSVDCRLATQALDSSGEARGRFVGAVLNMADARTARMYGARPLIGSRGHSPRDRARRGDTNFQHDRQTETA
jgi:succinoglycan biosynthesis transport protein ExoP